MEERLAKLEEEVKLLRRVTWSVCQGARETHGVFQHLREKAEFLKNLAVEEIVLLLNLKAEYTGVTDPVILDQELISVCVCK